MPVAKAAVTAGSVVIAIPEITAAAAIPAEVMAAAVEVEGVTVEGVVATEASPLAPVDLMPRRLFRFIPV
jgi:predicted membrane-bound mannosyltransferase